MLLLRMSNPINLARVGSRKLKVEFCRNVHAGKMAKSSCAIICVRIIGILDLFIAVALIGVASFQFAKGSSLLNGPKSDSEKLIRLGCYASAIYIFLLIQVVMSIRLYRAAGKIVGRSMYAIKVFGWWREWSAIYLMAMLLHAMVVLMLMEEGQRRIISLISSLGHAFVRPIGIFLVGVFKRRLELQQFPKKDLPNSGEI